MAIAILESDINDTGLAMTEDQKARMVALVNSSFGAPLIVTEAHHDGPESSPQGMTVVTVVADMPTSIIDGIEDYDELEAAVKSAIASVISVQDIYFFEKNEETGMTSVTIVVEVHIGALG